MIASGTVRLLQTLAWVTFSPIATLALLQPSFAQTRQPALLEDSRLAQESNSTDPNSSLRTLSLDSSLLSLQGGQRLMAEAGQAINVQNYAEAIQKLQQARQVFNQLSNFYQELASSFSGIDNRISDSQRRQAVDTAEMRDQATYQLALVHRAQNQPELAVPLLIQIVRSQNPTRELGKKAYQQLFELGFVDSPYPRPRGETGVNPNSPSSSNR